MNVVLLHGALGCADDFTKLAPLLNQQGLNPICFELSGHGSRPFSAQFSIAAFAKEIEILLQNYSAKNTVLFGYSMGGYVILELLSKHPELRFAFMTLATKWHWTVEIAEREKTLCSKAFLLEKAPQFYEALTQKHVQVDQLLAQTAELIESLGTAAAPDIASITSTCKILRGDKDKMVSEEECLALNAALPFSQFEILENTKHPLDTVSSDMLAQKISEFAKQVLNAE